MKWNLLRTENTCHFVGALSWQGHKIVHLPPALVIQIASFSGFFSEFTTGVSNTCVELTTGDVDSGKKFTASAIYTGGDIFTEIYIGRGDTGVKFAAGVDVANRW